MLRKNLTAWEMFILLSLLSVLGFALSCLGFWFMDGYVPGLRENMIPLSVLVVAGGLSGVMLFFIIAIFARK